MTVNIDHSWESYMGPLRSLAGTAMVLFGILAVIALLVWAAIGMFEQLSNMRGGAVQRVAGIACIAMLAGAVAGGVGFMSDQFGAVTISVPDGPAPPSPPARPSQAPSSGATTSP